MLAVVGWESLRLEREYLDLIDAFLMFLTITRIQFLRDIQTFFGTVFKIVNAESSESCPELLYSCLGVGYVNANRAIA